MRADKALEESKDGTIWIAMAAIVDAFGILWWRDTTTTAGGGVVPAKSVLSDNWQPTKPAGLCEACIEAKMTDTRTGMTTLETDHLRKWHCTCKKEG